MADIFSEFNIKDLKLKNRIVMPSMCMYSSDDNGMVKDFHVLHYVTRAIGGTGLIVIEATAVEKRGRISGNDLGIWNDDHIEGLKEIVDSVHKYGAKIGIQLAHAGRKNETGEDVIGPSPIGFNLKYDKPREMTIEDIDAVILSFQKAAERAVKAGFDYIEIHGAHGYLINEFLSSLTNTRNDKYGGGLEGRSKFLKKIVKSVREVWEDEKPLGIRISAYEYDKYGNKVEDLSFIINLIKDCGVDIINVSSGGVIDKKIDAYPGYQVNFGTQIKNMTGLPVMVGGLLEHYHMINEIIRNNRGDLVYMGRELLRNPYWVLQSSKKLCNDSVKWPEQYERAR